LDKPQKGKAFIDLFMNNFISTSSTVVRKECFDRIGMFDLSLPPAADYDRWLRVAADFMIDYIDKPLVKYRIHEDCFSKDSTVIMEKTIQALKGISNEFALPDHFAKQRFFHLYYRLGKAYVFKEDLRNARRCFQQALRQQASVRALSLYIFTFIGLSNLSRLKQIRKFLRKRSD